MVLHPVKENKNKTTATTKEKPSLWDVTLQKRRL
jgi:hypothetical protein